MDNNLVADVIYANFNGDAYNRVGNWNRVINQEW